MNTENLPTDLVEALRSSFPEEFSTSEAPTIEDAVVIEEESVVAPSIASTMEEIINNVEIEESSSPIEIKENIVEEVSEKEIVSTKANYARFKGADWFKIVQDQEIVLAGLGGIGSYVSFFLSRLGPKYLYLFDDDSFESHNMSGQLVSQEYINTSKVEVANRIAIKFSNFNNTALYNRKYIKGECLTTKVMICGFDNMKARRGFYESWKENIKPDEANEYLFIDGRLLAEEFQVLCIKGDDLYAQKEYEDMFLFDDLDVKEVDCTLKQTSHMAGMIASLMTTYFINFCNNLGINNFPRRLPYFTHYNSIVNTYDIRY